MPRPVAWPALTLLIAAVLAGGGAVAAGRAAVEAADEAAGQMDGASFRRTILADYVRMETRAVAALRRHPSAEETRSRTAQLVELRGELARYTNERNGFIRDARAADKRRRSAEGWRGAMTALAAALAAATALVGVATRPRPVRWAVAGLAAAVVTWGAWAMVADLIGAVR